MEVLLSPLPWYVAGPLIGLTIPLLLFLGNRQFGISATLQDICAFCVRGTSDFFRYAPETMNWRMWFAGGVVVAGLLSAWLVPDRDVALSTAAQATLSGLGLEPADGLYPQELLGGTGQWSWQTLVWAIGGGFLVGFGARYAGGCTSGHAIMGLSQFSPASLIATIGFFVGGLLMTHLVFPSLLPWLLH
jgi:uncharacterized protein